MVWTTWFTVFMALVCLSILIQTGILIGLYIAMRRTESLWDRWEPIILRKIDPVAQFIKQKTKIYAPQAERGLDDLASYTQRVRSTLSRQLENIHQQLQKTNGRWLQPMAVRFSAKKKARAR